MLKIILGNMDDVVYNTSVYFKNTYKEEWLTDDFSKEMIKDVDKSTVVSSRIIDSPVLGAITPKELSGGLKALILIYKDDSHVFNASNCGDDCAKWLLKIGEMKDVTINLRHIMDFGNGEFEIKIMNTDQTVHSMDEFVDVAGLIL
ncbi:MAG: DUF4869 domain-containing protein [Lachnospiraceae bacterium]|uniref:DUF4869 domain-containing protein n=1 Tax=Roseburia hominis TaxID=301301 RepID=UPI001F3A21E2|nr:DUF4869 domain-containing protein [Roseburia hominis]MCI5713320.1 DUF4869 domain-containing protein [Lachnospiraceae bacterium]MDD6170731.1 DUF4869 domain-containing protein [Lachnospiraceae bacterium]